jgi:hypothetical protein
MNAAALVRKSFLLEQQTFVECQLMSWSSSLGLGMIHLRDGSKEVRMSMNNHAPHEKMSRERAKGTLLKIESFFW